MKRITTIILSAISILSAIILVLLWGHITLAIRGITPRDYKPWTNATTFQCVEELFSAFVVLWIAIPLISNIKYHKITRFILLATSIAPFHIAVTSPLRFLNGYELMSNEFKALAIVLSAITAIFALAVILTLIIFAMDVLKPQKDKYEIPNTVTVEVKTSKSAIWSFICGIFGMILYLPLIPAIILGIIALVNIKKSKGLLIGKGWAIAGLILGCLFTLFFIL